MVGSCSFHCSTRNARGPIFHGFHAGRLFRGRSSLGWGMMSQVPGTSLKWDFCTVADELGRSVREAEDELRLEQAVYGLDARDERALQALLASKLSTAFEVAREVHYPSTRDRKLTHRMRCDLVLAPHDQPLRLDTAGPPGLFD